jgi:argininosuccinate synthase
MRKVKRAVLAYSGGLDTSIIVPWLREHYGCEVVCYCSDVGQGAELDGLEARARKSGASNVVVEDLRLPFVRDFCFPALRAGAVYEGSYLLGTSLARPLIAARQVACAMKTGADALAHGCTGKGNDQVRFELAYLALAPQLAVIAPWREWDIVSREDALAYAEKHGIPVPIKKGDLFSRDANLWHLSHEGGPLEDPANQAPETLYKLTANPDRRPARAETVRIGFERGVPVALDGRVLSPVELVQELNAIAGRHGVGRADLVESRLIGMKSRGVYETPAGTVLYEALEDLCRLVLPHDLLRTRAELAPRMADLIYNGQWFSPLRESLQAFVDSALSEADGEVTIELFQGQARAVARTSPRTLHRPDLASFDMTGYDARHAEGFIRLFGLPLATAARRDAESKPGSSPSSPKPSKGVERSAGAALKAPARRKARVR